MAGITSFFKIILEPINDLQKWGIPEKFMTDYGSELVNVVSLEIPTGKTWKVELLRENEGAWFRQGWSEFVKYNSISHGDFLNFRYQGESRFKVFIFDTTACEIDYPPFVPQETRDDEIQTTPVSDVPEETPDEIQITTVSDVPEETRDEIQTTTVSDVPKETPDEIQMNVSETKISEVDLCSPSSSSKEKRMVDLVRQYTMKQCTLTKTNINKINAREFKTPAFAMLIKPSYLYANFVVIPHGVISKYLKEKSSCTLKNATEKWQVKVGITIYKRLTKFQKGWQKFARYSKLRVGDACVFELIDAAKSVFNVEIIRCSSGVDDTCARGAKTGVE